MPDILTPVSPGELLDKITILQIKAEQISDAEKLVNVHTELEALSKVSADHIPRDATLDALERGLKDVNAQLWEIEDNIRDCERAGDFGDAFIQLARAVYVTNDRRAKLKKDINQHLGSRLVEEKSYAAY